MSDEQFLKSEETPAGGITIEDENGSVTARPAEHPASRYRVKKPRVPAESRLAVDEVAGRPPVDIVPGPREAAELEDHNEVAGEGDAATEAMVEAESAQLESAVPAEDDAFSDLRTVEGFEERRGEAAELEAGIEAPLPDAGSALAGGQEFLPVVSSLASTVIPMLASKAGPVLAKAVARRLTPVAKAALKRHVKGSGLISIAAKLFESAQEQPAVATEAGVDVLLGDGLVEEVTQTFEVIIGTDDRVRIQATQQIPWRRICALRIQMRSGAMYRGTGFFIGPRAVATAGHCVYIKSQGGWARRIEVIPGCNGTQRPYGQAIGTSFRSTAGWVNASKPEADYGCIVLPAASFGGNFGYFGFAAFSSGDLLASNAVLAGYPGDKPFAELWGMGRRIKSVTAQQLVYLHDTMGGQSGAPVYIKKGDKRYVVGIHNYGAATGNSATRVTPSVFLNLKRWSAIV